MLVYARYRHITALVADDPDPIHSHRLVRRLNQRYPLTGLKIWRQSDPNPSGTVAWEALRQIIVDKLAAPPEEPPPNPTLSERQAAAYLGFSQDRLRHEVNAGRLAFTGTRAKRRFAVAELNRWRDLSEQ
jgi:excisionase family DNA binding protein